MTGDLKTARGDMSRKQGRWTGREVARQESANRAQVQRDRARGIGANLSEAAALARFANRFCGRLQACPKRLIHSHS
jgi:hypothetical protein